MNDQMQAVQRMQDYLHTHVNDRLTLTQLAKVSGYSPFYAHRLFHKWTGLAPADYLRRLRLSQSAMRLRDEKVKVTDLAYTLGFQSVDGYQRAFLREFGCNPHEYARDPRPIYLFTPYGVAFSKTRKEQDVEQVQSIFIQVVEKPARKLWIKRGKTATDYFTYGEEVGCHIWGLLKSIPALSGEPVCLWLPKRDILPGISPYVQGVEVATDYTGQMPKELDCITYPAAKYLMFQGEPFAEEDYAQAITQVQQAIQRYNPSAIGLSWNNDQPRIQLEPIGERGYIELWPVK